MQPYPQTRAHFVSARSVPANTATRDTAGAAKTYPPLVAPGDPLRVSRSPLTGCGRVAEIPAANYKSGTMAGGSLMDELACFLSPLLVCHGGGACQPKAVGSVFPLLPLCHPRPASLE